MTTDIDKLEGQALRDAVMELVMDWHRGFGHWWDKNTNLIIVGADHFQPDLSMSDSMRVLEKMQEKGFYFVLKNEYLPDEKTWCYWCALLKDPMHLTAMVTGGILPIAICRASLKAVRGEKK